MLIQIFISILIVSLISLIGTFTIFFSDKKLNEIIFLFVGLSVGALLGDSFIHLLPESLEKSSPITVGLLVMFGILIFFLIEHFIQWRHCHSIECSNLEHKSFTTMVLIGDSTHNFIDGIIIASAYFVSINLGIVTTIAIILHEIPQEIGDFGVLIHGGYSKKKALALNFLSAIMAFLGAFIAFLLIDYIPNIISFFIPITAGTFIYIAASDLIPELHKTTKAKNIILQTISIIIGIALMYLLKVF